MDFMTELMGDPIITQALKRRGMLPGMVGPLQDGSMPAQDQQAAEPDPYQETPDNGPPAQFAPPQAPPQGGPMQGPQGPPQQGFGARLKAALPNMITAGIAGAATPNIAHGGATDVFRAMQAGQGAAQRRDLLAYQQARQRQEDEMNRQYHQAQMEELAGRVEREKAQAARQEALAHQAPRPENYQQYLVDQLSKESDPVKQQAIKDQLNTWQHGTPKSDSVEVSEQIAKMYDPGAVPGKDAKYHMPIAGYVHHIQSMGAANAPVKSFEGLATKIAQDRTATPEAKAAAIAQAVHYYNQFHPDKPITGHAVGKDGTVTAFSVKPGDMDENGQFNLGQIGAPQKQPRPKGEREQSPSEKRKVSIQDAVNRITNMTVGAGKTYDDAIQYAQTDQSDAGLASVRNEVLTELRKAAVADSKYRQERAVQESMTPKPAVPAAGALDTVKGALGTVKGWFAGHPAAQAAPPPAAIPMPQTPKEFQLSNLEDFTKQQNAKRKAQGLPPITTIQARMNLQNMGYILK